MNNTNKEHLFKKWGRKVNGDLLRDITGDLEQRNIHKKELFAMLPENKKQERAEKELEHIMKLEKDTAEKQVSALQIKTANLMTWVLTAIVVALIFYILIMVATGMFDIQHNTIHQAIIGFASTVCVSWFGVLVALYRKFNIEIKKNG